MESDYATTGCSKALWGLRLRVECTGLCASKVNFAGHIAGQWSPRWTIHASRQLSDKVLPTKGHSYPRCLLVLRQVETRFKIPALSRIQGLYTTFRSGSPLFLLNSRRL